MSVSSSTSISHHVGEKRKADSIEQTKELAKIEKVGDTVKYIFENGTVVTDSPKQQFARFTTNTPVLRPKPHDTSEKEIDTLLKEIKSVGYSAIRVMSNDDAKTLYDNMCKEYRTLLNDHPKKLKEKNPDYDLKTITLTELPKGLYSGRFGSGKLIANGFTNSASVWEARKKAAKAMEKVFEHAFGEKTSVMTSSGMILCWGPNLVATMHKEESLPRAFPHLDYKMPVGKEEPLLKPGIQSIVVLTEPDKGSDPKLDQTTATMVFPGSHHHYGEICRRTSTYPQHKKGGLPWPMLVDMVNEGKIQQPVRVTVPQGCALVWSRMLAHSPDSTKEGQRLALREASMPTKVVSLQNRIKNVLFFLTHTPNGGVDVNGDIKASSLYNRRGSTIWREMGWSKLPGVDPKYYQIIKKKTEKEYHEVGGNDLKKLFSPYEIVKFVTDPEMAHVLGVDDQKEVEKLKSLTWKDL